MNGRISHKTEILSMAQRERAFLKDRFAALILMSLGLVSMPPKLYGQAGAPVWTNHYVGPNGVDSPTAAAIDGSGNVFVTGYSGNQVGTSNCFATVAYSSAGVPLWTNLYRANDYSRAYAIAVDPSGNVVVTGDSGGSCDTIKYSGAGVALWTNSYPSAGDQCTVAVDSNGNVFTVGASGIEAYSSGGSLLWSNNVASAAGDTPAAAVDSSGSVIVTEPADSIGSGNFDYLTSKYSGAGVPLWTNRYSVGGSSYPKAIAVDSSGNAFVTGYSFTGTNYCFATVCYSASGVPLWTNRFNRAGGSDDRAAAIAVDARGNVFVTGRSDKAFESEVFEDYEYATVAYSSSGMQLWTNLYDNGYGNIPVAIAADTSGNVFVTGASLDNGPGYATLAYSGVGVPLWTNRYDAAPGPSYATAIAVDGSGNVFVSGQSNDSPPYDGHYTTIKYSSTAPKLNIQNLNSGFVLTWTAPGWNLQFAPTPASTFTSIPGATSPYTNTIDGQAGYFRLQAP